MDEFDLRFTIFDFLLVRQGKKQPSRRNRYRFTILRPAQGGLCGSFLPQPLPPAAKPTGCATKACGLCSTRYPWVAEWQEQGGGLAQSAH